MLAAFSNDQLLSDPNEAFREGLDTEIKQNFPLACPLVPHVTQFTQYLDLTSCDVKVEYSVSLPQDDSGAERRESQRMATT